MEFSTGAGLSSFKDLLVFFGPKMAFALICGGLVGLERELKNKSAGIKTNMLICLGSALYTALSVVISKSIAEDGFFGDPARIAAQIVTGIGFLGGGAIIQSRGNITGLTTAATIWVVAAIGICIGLGQLAVGVVISLSVVGTLLAITSLEHRFIDQGKLFHSKIVADANDGKMREELCDQLLKLGLRLEEFDERTENGEIHFDLYYRGMVSRYRKFHEVLWKDSRIRKAHHR